MFKLKLTFFLIFISVSLACPAAAPIKNYHPIFIAGIDQNGTQLIAIRNYQLNNDNYFLTINPNTLATKIITAEQLTIKSCSQLKLKQSIYLKLLQTYSQPPYKLQNYGVTHAAYPVTGMFLTIDLCPSTKPLEKRLFESLQGPIAIAITGRWLQQHPDDFNWLITQPNFQITWINHSYSHPYQKNIALNKNFLLSEPKNFTNEVLATEKLLIANGQTPSIYFRFPGLVANKQLILKLAKLGLLPIGADAWLAKNEKPTNGSIILVHGNGNEPLGVDLFLKLLAEQNFKLLPLDYSVRPS
jgi:hypothetical protein